MTRWLWLRNVLDVTRSRKDRRRLAARSRKPVRLLLEPLEDRITPSGFQTLYSFTEGSDGGLPYAGVVVDGSGNLYGVTKYGGIGGGTLFKYSNSTFSVLYTFNNSSGYNPLASMVLDSKGDLFGTTSNGGTDNQGTVFEYSAKGTFTVLHNFTGTDGSTSEGGLIMDSKGDLFGTTFGGGGNGSSGTVFELSPDGSGNYSFNTLHAFSLSDGINLMSGLVLDSQGNLYGTTTQGGTGYEGTVFELSPNGSGPYNFSVLYNFPGGSQASQGVGGLILDGSGNLYGTTYNGVVFKLNPTSKAFDVLYNLPPSDNLPSGNLLMDSQGNLYGTAYGNLSGSSGAAFELSPNGSGGYNLTNLHLFSGSGTDGANPYPGLVADSNGNLYGTTVSGGSNGKGTLFELTGAVNLTSTTTVAGNASDSFSTNTQNVTLTAQVNTSAGAVNQGTVTFTILQGNTVIGTAATSSIDSNGQASVSYALPSVLAAGTYTIDAVYNPVLGLASSSDTKHSLTVSAANVTTTANNAIIVVPKQQTVTLSAAVADSSFSSDTVNEGTVTFTVKDSKGNTVGNTVNGTVSGGTASANYALPSGQAPGNYTIDVSYSDGGGNFTDSGDTSATLTVQLLPTVTTNPSNQTVTAGQTATFAAAANGNPTPTVQWQVSSDGGKTFTNISGATSTTLTLSNVQNSQDGDEYQAVFTNSAGSATTSAATLTVDYAPAVTTNPTNLTVLAGQSATFTAASNGDPAATVQWQSSSDGTTWSNLSDGQDVSGSTTNTLTLSNVTILQNNEELRAVFTNSLGTATSSAATLTVSLTPVAPSITGQPSNQTAAAGQNATFTASASGSPTPTVQWQVSSDGGKTFTNISGATSTTLTLSNVQIMQSGDEYQAVFTNSAGSATTGAATLTVDYAPSVTTNPSNETVMAGQTATFTAAANGNPTPTVQWQVSSDDGATWTTISGATSTTLTLTNATAAMNGNEYQAVFTNSVGSATTTAATLAVQFAPAVTVNPNNQTVTAGNKATFTAAASGNPMPTVQWQVSTDGGATWTDISGATSTTLTLNGVLLSLNGDEYRAVFSNSLGAATTTAAVLTVQTLPAITSGNSITFTIGQSGSFAVTATGSPTPTLTESGALPGGITFTDNGNGTASLAGISSAGTQGTYQFAITAHNGAGSIAQNFTLTVNPAPLPPPPLPPPALPPTAPPSAPPSLNVPPLLALFDSLLGGTVTVNADGTETITDSLFGIPLLVSTFDAQGNLASVSLFGFTIPNWIWSV